MSTLARLLPLVLLLAACVQLPLISPTGRDTLALLDDFERMARLPAGEQDRAVAAAEASFERAPTDVQRLRLALALSLPPTSAHNDGRILELLAPFGETQGAAPLRELALVLRQAAAERQALRESQRTAETAWRDEQRRSAAWQQKHDAAQQRYDALQQKLDALRAIDRDMRRSAPR